MPRLPELMDHMSDRPRGLTVIGSGPMANGIRSEIARDPDRYAPETWSIDPVGFCPCCDEHVYRCTTRHTGWSEGFATHSNVVHPRLDTSTALPDPNGTAPGCCCVAPNWGPKHSETAHPTKKRAPKKRSSSKNHR